MGRTDKKGYNWRKEGQLGSHYSSSQMADVVGLWGEDVLGQAGKKANSKRSPRVLFQLLRTSLQLEGWVKDCLWAMSIRQGHRTV